MTVDSNYKDLLRAFDRHGVRYLVAGGFAVMLYTEPRFTKDLDVWVDPARENAPRVRHALMDFGAPLQGVDELAFTEQGHIYQIGVNPIRIDVMMAIGDLVFEDAWRRRTVVDFDGLPAAFLSKEDLIYAKKSAGRPQDRLDLRRLLKSESKSGRRRSSR